MNERLGCQSSGRKDEAKKKEKLEKGLVIKSKTGTEMGGG